MERVGLSRVPGVSAPLPSCVEGIMTIVSTGCILVPHENAGELRTRRRILLPLLAPSPDGDWSALLISQGHLLLFLDLYTHNQLLLGAETYRRTPWTPTTPIHQDKRGENHWIYATSLSSPSFLSTLILALDPPSAHQPTLSLDPTPV